MGHIIASTLPRLVTTRRAPLAVDAARFAIRLVPSLVDARSHMFIIKDVIAAMISHDAAEESVRRAALFAACVVPDPSVGPAADRYDLGAAHGLTRPWDSNTLKAP